GSEIPYVELVVDYSESFLFNEFNIAGSGGSLATASDATSISKYFKRARSISSSLLLAGNAATIASALLAKYKDPMLRVTSISFDTTDPATSEAVFRRELMDKITVKRTPPGGGSRISQDLFIEKIAVSVSNDGRPAKVTWGVSPL